MTIVLLTALGVGGATVIGALAGFLFKGSSHKFSDVVLSFAAVACVGCSVLFSVCKGVCESVGSLCDLLETVCESVG